MWNAHGEDLRSIERRRLRWSDVPTHTKEIGKALQRAHLARQLKANAKPQTPGPGVSSKAN